MLVVLARRNALRMTRSPNAPTIRAKEKRRQLVPLFVSLAPNSQVSGQTAYIKQGQYKDCKCKAECPDPKKKALICSNKSCEGKDGKCTTV